MINALRNGHLGLQPIVLLVFLSQPLERAGGAAGADLIARMDSGNVHNHSRIETRRTADGYMSHTGMWPLVHHQPDFHLLILWVPFIKRLNGGAIVAIVLKDVLHALDSGCDFFIAELFPQVELAGINKLSIAGLGWSSFHQD